MNIAFLHNSCHRCAAHHRHRGIGKRIMEIARTRPATFIRLAAIISAVLLALFTGATRAEPGKPADVPGGDIFGFTGAAGVGEVGDHGVGFELDGAFGKGRGQYRMLTQKYAYERVIAPNTSAAIAFFTVYHSIDRRSRRRGDTHAFQFDGMGFEIAHRLVERSATNPFSFKIALEPRWARINGGGRHAESWGAELKFIADAVVIPGKLFWAGNIVLDVGAEEEIGRRHRHATGAGVKISSALTWQFSPRVFAGVEATYLHAFEKIFARRGGHAVFAGPTLFVKLSDKASLNATIAPQIAGRAVGMRGRFDLDNYERLISRVKLTVDF